MAETSSIQAPETAAFDLERNCSSEPFCEFAEEKGGPLAALFYFAARLTKSRFSVPILHCEFEGSRTHDMLAALEGFPECQKTQTCLWRIVISPIGVHSSEPGDRWSKILSAKPNAAFGTETMKKCTVRVRCCSVLGARLCAAN